MKIFLLIVMAVTLLCSCGKQEVSDCTPDLQLSINRDVAASEPLHVAELKKTQLAGEDKNAFFSRASILDVVGDTLVMVENSSNASRLILFSTNDGSFLGEINHMGQGPGEYRRILGAFVNRHRQSVLVPDFDSPKVNIYSLKDGNLLEIKEREFTPSVIEPIGGVESCINNAQPSQDGLKIMQYDVSYSKNDSIELPGFHGCNFSAFWTNAGGQGVIAREDTIYSLAPGKINPIAVLSRGKYLMTPEQDNDIFMQIMMEGKDDAELLKPYILVRDVQLSGNHIALTTMYDNEKRTDIYDLESGDLLYRNRYSSPEIPSQVVLADGDSMVAAGWLFGKDGVWYGLVDEGADGDSGSVSAEKNYALVSFTL
jgi:hypothetical protein